MPNANYTVKPVKDHLFTFNGSFEFDRFVVRTKTNKSDGLYLKIDWGWISFKYMTNGEWNGPQRIFNGKSNGFVTENYFENGVACGDAT